MRFAAEAALRPSEPHVLIIDEINRGNLPRIFRQLLYLLEYREQTVGCPYSPPLPAMTNPLPDRHDERRRWIGNGGRSSIAAPVLFRRNAAGCVGAGRMAARSRSDDRPRLRGQGNYLVRAAQRPPPALTSARRYKSATVIRGKTDLDELPRLRLIWRHHVRLLDECFARTARARRRPTGLDQMMDGKVRRPARV